MFNNDESTKNIILPFVEDSCTCIDETMGHPPAKERKVDPQSMMTPTAIKNQRFDASTTSKARKFAGATRSRFGGRTSEEDHESSSFSSLSSLASTAAARRKYSEDYDKHLIELSYRKNNIEVSHCHDPVVINAVDEYIDSVPSLEEKGEDKTAAIPMEKPMDNSFSDQASEMEEEDQDSDEYEQEKFYKRAATEADEEEVFVALVKVVSALLHECHEVQASYRTYDTCTSKSTAVCYESHKKKN